MTADQQHRVGQALRDADEISARIIAGGYRGNLSDTETLRNHVRALAAMLQAGRPTPSGGAPS